MYLYLYCIEHYIVQIKTFLPLPLNLPFKIDLKKITKFINTYMFSYHNNLSCTNTLH